MTEPFRLAGVYSVLPTAFHDDGRLDLDGTASLVVQILGTATLEDNVAAKEAWTAITERFAATLAT